MPPFLDANVCLRQLLADHPVHSPACFKLFQAIERGEVVAWTTHLVIAEVVFVVSNKRTYNVGRERIRDLLLPLIGLPGLKLANKRLFRRVFDLYVAHPMSFVDAYHTVLVGARQPPELYSYDTDFDRVAGLTRLEP
jgi:predicted nucleic acid-binding protein